MGKKYYKYKTSQNITKLKYDRDNPTAYRTIQHSITAFPMSKSVSQIEMEKNI